MTADTTPRSLAQLLASSRSLLAKAGIPDAALDARLIVEHFSATSRADAISAPDRIVAVDAVMAIDAALGRRITGEPVHRILGFREFYGLQLALSAETLEPRPDTEVLVDALLPFLRDVAAREGGCRIIDLGTGTGAIALALLSEVPLATATGVDLSEDALATARGNAERLGLGARFSVQKSDWFTEIHGKFHAIAANPPYIPTNDLLSLQREVRNFDPARALDGGADGLDAYRVIAKQAENYLEPSGRVALEIGHTQKEAVTRLFEAAGYRAVEARSDLAGHDRVLVFQR
ncbi:peptide chain release factor N(5)-glutamine methyltransferase [Mesorhizobium sp. 10J20-29]